MWEFDVMKGSNDPCTISPRFVGVTLDVSLKRSYLVNSGSSLLAAIRAVEVNDEEAHDYGTSEFKVFEIDVEQGEYSEVESLGNRALFLGYSAPLSLDTSGYPGLVPNSIYFTDDTYDLFIYNLPEGEGKDMGIYNLGDKSIQPHYRGNSLSLVCPPVWIFSTYR